MPSRPSGYSKQTARPASRPAAATRASLGDPSRSENSRTKAANPSAADAMWSKYSEANVITIVPIPSVIAAAAP